LPYPALVGVAKEIDYQGGVLVPRVERQPQIARETLCGRSKLPTEKAGENSSKSPQLLCKSHILENRHETSDT